MDKNKWWLFAMATVMTFTKSVWLSGAPVGEVAIISVITIAAIIFIAKTINWSDELKRIDRKTFFYIIASIFTLFVLTVIHGSLNPTPPNQQGLIATMKQIGTLRFAIPVVIVAPIMEELLYRRFIIGKCAKTNLTANIVRLTVSSLLFGFMHTAYGGSLADFIFYTTSGLVLGSVYMRRTSIIDSILTHVTYNTIGLLITILTIG